MALRVLVLECEADDAERMKDSIASLMERQYGALRYRRYVSPLGTARRVCVVTLYGGHADAEAIASAGDQLEQQWPLLD